MARSELAYAAELLNRVTDGVDGVRIGLHVCRGNWRRKEEVLLAEIRDAAAPAPVTRAGALPRPGCCHDIR